MAIPFCKFHGFGNDYLVLQQSDIGPTFDHGDLAIKMCHRNTGVGGDGLAIIKKLSGGGADYFCEIVNPDGSIAAFSGNGTRCAVAYLYYKGLWDLPSLQLETQSGVKSYHLLERISEGSFDFEAEIGKPRFVSDEIPVYTPTRREAVVNEPVLVAGHQYLYSAVNVGNPVACIYVDDFDFDWTSVGRILETHSAFPQRANIVFLKVIDRGNIEIRIWERGAGETAASGTCASGAAVLSAFMLKTDRKVRVHSPGGTTDINWLLDDQIVIRGRADLAFCGEWPD